MSNPLTLTKYKHSCVKIVNNKATILIDPGNLNPGILDDVRPDLILVTHIHPDHFLQEELEHYLHAFPHVQVYTNHQVKKQLKTFKTQVHCLEPRTTITQEGFEIQAQGGIHALINPHLSRVDNIGFIIDQKIYHPGDSLYVPPKRNFSTALLPLWAPWSKTSEVIDFMISLNASQSLPIHNGFVTPKELISSADNFKLLLGSTLLTTRIGVTATAVRSKQSCSQSILKSMKGINNFPRPNINTMEKMKEVTKAQQNSNEPHNLSPAPETEPTIFTQIINGKIPADFVWKDKQVVAFMDNDPRVRGHVLVVPRSEISQWSQLSTELLDQTINVAQKIAQAQKKAFSAPRAGLAIEGFEVPHTHMHVMPLYDVHTFEQEKVGATPEELHQDAEKILHELKALGYNSGLETA